MSLAPSQIIAGVTEDQVADLVIAALRDGGFRTTSWQPGSIQRTLIQGFSRAFAGGSNVLRDALTHLLVSPGGPGDAAGLWQDIKGTYWYGLPRLEAVRAIREITFTSAASAPPHVITTGSQVTANGVAFETTAAATALAPGASVTLAARAIEAGTSGNVAAGTTCALVTPYAGAAAALAGDPSTAGAPRESNARYQLRLDLRWSELTYSVGLRAYELWALTSDASINRVRAWSNHPNPNEIMVAIEPGTVGQIANAQSYFAGRSAVNDLPTAVAANPNPQTITMAPRIRVGTTTVAEIEAAITAYLDAMPLGGVMIAGASNGRLLRESIHRIVLCGFPGVESVSLSTPAADVILGATDYVVPTYVIDPEWIT